MWPIYTELVQAVSRRKKTATTDSDPEIRYHFRKKEYSSIFRVPEKNKIPICKDASFARLVIPAKSSSPMKALIQLVGRDKR